MFGLALVLGFALTALVRDIYVRQTTQQAELVACSGLTDEIAEAGLSRSLSPEERSRLDLLVRSELKQADIFAMKLWNDSGVLVYSSDRADVVGSSFADDEEIIEALSGETAAEVYTQPTDENSVQFTQHGAFIEVYAPLVDPESGKTMGIFEVYKSYAPVLDEIRMANIIIWSFVLVGSALAYGIQLGIVRRAADRIRTSEDQVVTVNSRLSTTLQEIEEHSLGTLQALTSAVDAKDSYTASHSLSVTDYAVIIGKRMGLSAAEMADLERASLLHDIGKIGIPESILLKPTRLTTEEFEVVKDHSDMGSRIIESIPFLRDLQPVILHHHERWDGTGYPQGLAGERIPRLARILAVADAFDAMTSNRPYRPAMRLGDARQELLRGRGIQFEPAAVDALLRALDAGDISVARWHATNLRVGVSTVSA